MTEKVGMNIYVRAVGANEAKVSLDSITRSAEKLEKTTGQYIDSQGRLRDSNGRFAKTNDTVSRSIGGVTQSAGEAATAMGALKKAVIGYLSFSMVRETLAMADTMTSLGSQIRFVTSSLKEASAVQNELFDISNRTLSSLEATTNLYTRTARALKDAGKSQADFLKFTEATNNAMRIGGRNATEQSSALLQLSQALGSGVLQGDEFRSIAENAPILLDLVAQELGVVRGEVKKLSSDGKITSEVIFNALTNASEKLKKDASTMTVTLAQSLQVMRTSFMKVTDKALNSTGIMATLASGVVFLAENLEFVLIPAVGIAGVAITTMFGAATKAAMAFTVALATNPIGLIVVGITAATTALYHFRNEIILNKELGLTLGDVVGGAFDNIKEYATTAWSSINTTFNTVFEHISGEVGEFEITFDSVFTTISRIARTPGNIIINSFVAAINLSMGIFNNFVEFMIAVGKSIAFYFLNPFEQAINSMQMLLEGLVDGFSQIPGFGDMEVKFERFSFASQFEDDVDKMKTMFSEGISVTLDEMRKVILNDPLGDLIGTLFYGKAAQGNRDDRLGGNKTEPPFGGKGGSGGGLSGGSGGLDLVNAYTKKLSTLSDETAKLVSLNAQLSATGYESQYNAASSLTNELQSQTSALSKLSEAQKQVLLLKAEELDAQKQINEILKLGSDYDQRLDDMEFELTLMGRSKEQIDAMRYARELETRAKIISIGMSEANIALLNEEIKKHLELYGVIQKKKEEQENSIGQGIQNGMQKYIDNVGGMAKQFEEGTMSVLNTMETALFDFATTGKLNFRDMTTSILQDLAKIMIRMAMMQAVQGMMGMFSGGGHVSSGAVSFPYQAWAGGLIPEYATGGRVVDFSGGGFTGAGGTYEAKGVVHGGEYVISKKAVNNLGIDYLEKLHNSAKNGMIGYASGGIVGNDKPKYQPNHFVNPVSKSNSSEKSGDIIINQTIHYQGDQGEQDGKNAGQGFAKGFREEVRRILRDEMRPGAMLGKVSR